MDQPSKFRKIPVEIEAIQFTGENWTRVNQFVGQFENDNGDLVWGFLPASGEDKTLLAMVWDKLHYTWVGVKKDQWIIKGVQGEFYPCDDEVFGKTYEEL